MHKSIIAGVDIGGSHITAALVDMESRAVIEHTLTRASLDAKGSKAAITKTWCDSIRSCFALGGILPGRLGIAIPGPFDYDNGICLMQNQDKYDALYGTDLKKILTEHLSVSTENITFINDAAAFLQGEVYGGAARYRRNVLGITLGTGLGSALHLGNTTVDANLWSSSFLDGIAEDYFSTRWFIKRNFELTGIRKNNVKEIVDAANTNIAVRRLFDEFSLNLVRFLLPVIEACQVEMVVLGGNISNAFDFFSKPLQKYLGDFVPEVAIVKNSLGESAALLGAASYFDKKILLY